MTKNNARVKVSTASDGHKSISIDVDLTEEQIRIIALEEIFRKNMNLLKANNSNGSMTAAMWLLLEDAYYNQGIQCEWTKWKKYLKGCENND